MNTPLGGIIKVSSAPLHKALTPDWQMIARS
jgi:hypothetical protein